MQAQEVPAKDNLTKTDSIATKRKPIEIKIGFDLGKYLWARLNRQQSTDFFVHANVYKNYIVCFDFGREKHHIDSNLYDAYTTGNYYRLGLNYNLYKNWPGMDNVIAVGAKLGYSKFDHLIHSYKVNQAGAIFLPETIVVDKKIESLNGIWLELLGNMQVETFKNIYLGMEISVKYLISSDEINDFSTAYIPGFFSTNPTGFGFGMKYTIGYRFKL